MSISNSDAVKRLEELLIEHQRDGAWLAERVGKSYQWVYRRLRGRTPMLLDDYRMLVRAFGEESFGAK